MFHRGARYVRKSPAQRWRHCERCRFALSGRHQCTRPCLSTGADDLVAHLRVDHKLLERGQKDRLVPAQRTAHCAAPSSKSTPHAAYSGIAAACATQRLHATLHAPSLYAALAAYEPLRTFSEGTGRAVRSALLSAPCFRSPARRTAQSHDDASRSGTEVRRGRTSDARWLAAAVTVTTWRFSATAERASLFMRLARSSQT